MKMNKCCSKSNNHSVSDLKKGMEGFETDENEGYYYCSQRGGFVATPNHKNNNMKKKKKLLAERNVEEEEEEGDSCNKHNTAKIVFSPPVLYDPVTNFTSPRPEFLRYNPNRRREILQRMEDGNGSSSSSSERDQEQESSASPSPCPKEEEEEEEIQLVAEEEMEQAERDGSDYDADDGDTEEEEEVVERSSRWCSRMVWKLLLLFGLYFISCQCWFPTNPLLQEIEGPGDVTVPQMPRNSLRRDLLMRTQMGLSDTCLGVGEQLMCPISGSAEETCAGSLAIGDEGLNNDDDMVMPDVVTGDEEKSAEDALVAMEEGAGEVATPHQLFEPVHDGRGVMEALEDDATGADDAIHFLESERVQAMAVASTGTEVEESVDFTESLEIPNSAAPAPCAQQDGNQDPDSETLFRWNHQLSFFSREVQLLFIWISLLAAALVGLLSVLLKYFATPTPPSSPELPPPCSRSVMVVEELTDGAVDEKTIEPPMMTEESRDKELSISSLDRLREKYHESYATRQPTLRLLGEFSLAEAAVTGIGGGENFDGVEPEARSSQQLSQSGRKKGSDEEWHISESQRRSSARKKKKNLSISADKKVHPYPSSTESTMDANHKTQQKKLLPKTEDSGGSKSEEKLAATPLRRSDRLRNRVTSP